MFIEQTQGGRTRVFSQVQEATMQKNQCVKTIIPANCRLPADRLEELQCYKFLQAIRADDFHLITELRLEAVDQNRHVVTVKNGHNGYASSRFDR